MGQSANFTGAEDGFAAVRVDGRIDSPRVRSTQHPPWRPLQGAGTPDHRKGKRPLCTRNVTLGDLLRYLLRPMISAAELDSEALSRWRSGRRFCDDSAKSARVIGPSLFLAPDHGSAFVIEQDEA